MPTDNQKRDESLFIDGAWVEAVSGARLDVLNPADGTPAGTVADAGVEEAQRALEAAHRAQPQWAQVPPRARSEILLRCFEGLRAQAEDLARLITIENGKSLRDARAEVSYAAEFFRWFAEEAVRIGGEMSLSPSGNNRILVQHQPIGVALLITPWNFPAAMATRKLAPALAAGCSVVLKPARETPLTALAIVRIMQAAGVPAGTVNVLTSSRTSAVVGAMMADSRLRKLSFTGSTQVGRTLLAQAAPQVLKCSMELGGNAPFIVFEDADLPAAVEGAMIAKMRNGGQACTAANRFLVHESVEARFSQMLVERMGQLRLGNGLEEDTDCGPLINARAAEEVAELVDDAVARGARIALGGQKPEGCFYAPTVLRVVPSDARILDNEIFGPVAPIMTFRTEEEAITLANATEYGLVSYLYSSDLARGLRVSAQLEAGMVALNRGLVSDPAAPFGGMKQSGLGREGASCGLHQYLEMKYIATQWS